MGKRLPGLVAETGGFKGTVSAFGIGLTGLESASDTSQQVNCKTFQPSMKMAITRHSVS